MKIPLRRTLPLHPWAKAVPVLLLLLLVACAFLVLVGKGRSAHQSFFLEAAVTATRPEPDVGNVPQTRAGRDSFGDGWPDVARLEDARDRENFARWLTFLAESVYYHPAPGALEEIQDCAALIRYAYRNALMAHTPAWHQSVSLPFEPGFGDVTKFTYPQWPLARGLFRTRPGPLSPGDLDRSAFAEFADAATLLHYNTFQVARDLAAARPGDLLFFRQPEQREPFHSMLFVGRSNFQSQGNDWIVYHTGDLDGRRGEVRLVAARLLTGHPDPRWRPLAANPRFLGVYRFTLLR